MYVSFQDVTIEEMRVSASENPVVVHNDSTLAQGHLRRLWVLRAQLPCRASARSRPCRVAESKWLLLSRAHFASISVMYIKHCPACNQEFPSGAWTCPYCGAGPVIESEEQWQRSLSRFASLGKWAMYWSATLIALVAAMDLRTLGWFALLAPAYWSNQYFLDRVAGNTAQLSPLLFVRQEDPLSTKGIYDVLMGLVSACVVATAVTFAVINVLG